MPALSLTQPPSSDPPQSVVHALTTLEGGLKDDVPAKSADNLLIGTWNIRGFGGLTEAWETKSGQSPLRNWADLAMIAEIVSRFDVVAIQETRDNLRALRFLMGRLGSRWGFIVTDVGEGEAANGERLAYAFDKSRIALSGLAGELVVPEEWFGQIEHGALQRQFARTPYAVSFAAGDQAFTLVTLHVIYGHKPADRIAELRAIAAWLAERAANTDDFNRNLIALGDFNIDRRDDPNWQAFTDQGLSPPEQLYGLPRTIFDTASDQSFFDQIAWFTRGNREALTLHYTGKAGNFEWTKYLLEDLEKTTKSWHISDHYPLWAQFAPSES
jgi:endonuclease/exonuclease/phosphatase family metal-dependent hydrolase